MRGFIKHMQPGDKNINQTLHHNFAEKIEIGMCQ